MALYLTRFSYAPETWARLMKNPEDRREAARKYIESVGGKLHGFWYAFGTADIRFRADRNATVVECGQGACKSLTETGSLQPRLRGFGQLFGWFLQSYP